MIYNIYIYIYIYQLVARRPNPPSTQPFASPTRRREYLTCLLQSFFGRRQTTVLESSLGLFSASCFIFGSVRGHPGAQKVILGILESHLGAQKAVLGAPGRPSRGPESQVTVRRGAPGRTEGMFWPFGGPFWGQFGPSWEGVFGWTYERFWLFLPEKRVRWKVYPSTAEISGHRARTEEGRTKFLSIGYSKGLVLLYI